MNAQFLQKWWFTLKSVVFGLSSSLPPLVGGGGGLVCESVVKADLLSDHFNGKQSWESVDLPITCHRSPRLTTFAFRSREVRRLLLDLDSYGSTDPLGMFPLFKRTADVLAPRLSVEFRRLVRLGCFPASSRQAKANVTPIPSGPPSSPVANYRPVFITSALSRVFERLVSVRLGRFMVRSGVLQSTRFPDRKGMGTCDDLLCVSHALQSALENVKEARIVQIDSSAAFDIFNHQGILYKLCSVGIGGSVLSIFAQFLSNRSRSKLVNAVLGMPQGSVLGQVLFLLYIS